MMCVSRCGCIFRLNTCMSFRWLGLQSFAIHSYIVIYICLLVTTYTVADTCHILCFLELATRLEYKTVQILATRCKYYKRVLNISSTFETFKTRLKHQQRVLNIRNWFEYSNVFKTLATRLKFYKRVLNINVFETFATRLKHLKRILNIINVF